MSQHPARHASHPQHVPQATPYSRGNGDFLLETAQKVGITDRKELANFMGQMQVESHGFTKAHENLHYSGQNVFNALHKRHPEMTRGDADAIAKGGPEKVAEAIYGGRRDLGNTEPGDGWKFHGRGFVQLTGHYNYERYGKALGLDLVNHPDLAADPANAAKIAVQYWKETVVRQGHQTDVTQATRDINGGSNGLAERKAAAAQWETKLTQGYKPNNPELGQSLQNSLLYQQAHAALEKIDAQFGRKSDHLTDNAAAAIAVTAQKAGMTHIDHIEPGGSDNGKLFVVQGKPGTAHSKVVDVSTVDVMQTPVAQSAVAFEETRQAQQRTAHESAQVVRPVQQQAASALAH